MVDIFDVIADATRRDILAYLRERQSRQGFAGQTGEASVSEIVSALEISQPTVSKHLKVLRDTNLVTVREDGQHRYYRLDAAPLEDVQDWLIEFLDGDEVAQDAATLAAIGLARDQREFAETLGKRAAELTDAARRPLGWLRKE
ncbi:MAG TPA: metalloregulator ArsR/SmtB family transcription factor [Microbacteriaceae bacterium]|nr:metalloregulator ArsR/SmtB family transcription factor [Microbacteriaceae bacterium]